MILVHNKTHLTPNGLNQLTTLRLAMNINRSWVDKWDYCKSVSAKKQILRMVGFLVLLMETAVSIAISVKLALLLFLALYLLNNQPTM